MGMFPLRTSGLNLIRTAGQPMALEVEALEQRRLLSVQFAPTESITTVDSGVNVLAADFDRDGFGDIAIAHNDRNVVTVLFGDAGSTFRRRTSLFTTDRPIGMTSEDFNQDGFTDLAVVTGTGVVNSFLADGAGRMRRAGNTGSVAIPVDGPFVAAAAVDVGPDGDWDIFGLSEVGVGLLANEGEGEFDGALNIPNPANPPLIEADFGVRFDGLNLRLGGRDFDVVYDQAINEVNIIIATQDLDQQDRGVVAILREDFPDPVNNPIGPNFMQGFFVSSFVDLPWAPSAIAQGDVSGDGRYDIVVVAETEAEFAVLTADRGGFSVQLFSLGSINGGNDIEISDLDRDGDLDVVIGADEAIIVFENQGFGRFANAAVQTLTVDIDDIALIDYDRDGRDEIVGISISDDILIFQDLSVVDGIVEINVTPGATVSSAIRAGVNPQVTVRNTAGNPLAFIGNQFAGFQVADVRAETTGGAISADAKSFVDIKDGRGYAVAPSATGLILYRDNGSFFTQRNLADETRVGGTFTDVVPVVGVDGLARLFAFRANGDIILFEQNGTSDDLGEFFWFARNLSTNDLTESEFGTPNFASPIVSYVTPWNSIHIAGLDADGRIFTVWTSGALGGTFTSNDLTAVSSAPAIVGNLAVFVQPWGAVNLAGTDTNGDLIVTWWRPGFGGMWRNDNLSTVLGDTAPSLVGSTLTAFVTPWSGQNIVGLDGSGDLITVWWSPASNAWVSTNLTDVTPDAVSLSIGPLAAEAGRDGTIYIFGTAIEGDVTSYAFSASTFWRTFNLSETAVAR